MTGVLINKSRRNLEINWEKHILLSPHYISLSVFVCIRWSGCSSQSWGSGLEKELFCVAQSPFTADPGTLWAALILASCAHQLWWGGGYWARRAGLGAPTWPGCGSATAWRIKVQATCISWLWLGLCRGRACLRALTQPSCILAVEQGRQGSEHTITKGGLVSPVRHWVGRACPPVLANRLERVHQKWWVSL